MAAITTREVAGPVGTGVTVANVPLSNAQIDQNFINLNSETISKLPLSGGTLTGKLVNNSLTRLKGTSFVLSHALNGTPTNGYLITTNIEFGPFYMPKIRITGYAYGLGQVIDLSIVYYIYPTDINGSFGSYVVLNHGTWDPGQVKLAMDNNNKVVIHLENNGYYYRFNVIVDNYANEVPDSYLEGWTVSDAVCPAAKQVNLSQVKTLTSNNYNSYSPTLTGTGASGTWDISITGNSATATNVAWSGITSKPTTLSGFGITDALPLTGGTLTGDLTVGRGASTNLVIQNPPGDSRIYTNQPTLFLGASNSIPLSLTNTTLTMSGTINGTTVQQGGNQVLHAGNFASYADAPPILGVPRINLGDPTVREMALFDSEFTNKIDLYDITKVFIETSTDNVNWTTFSVTDANKRLLVGGDSGYSGLSIPYGTQYFRIRLRANSYVYLNALYSYWSSNGHSTSVKIFTKHDLDSGWSVVANSANTVSSWPGHLYLPHNTIPWHLAGAQGSHYHEVYVVFQPVWNATYSANSISLYKLQWWGGYPAGRRNLYSTDEYGNASFPAAVSAVGAAYINSNQVLHAGNYNSYSPTLTGTGASGNWGISITGNAATASTAGSGNILRFSDGTSFNGATTAISTSGSRSVDLAPNTYNFTIAAEFKNSSLYSFTGNYVGLVTIAPWLGTTASTGDPSYQLAFHPSAVNSTSNPSIKVRAGIDTTWGAWSLLLHSANYNSYAPTLTGSGASGTWGINVTGSAGSVAWTNVSGRPTTVSSFTNDSGYITSAFSGFMLRSTSVQANPNTNFVSSAYRFDPNANNPTNEHYAIVTYGNESNVVGQLATHFTSGQTFTRAYNSAWSSWRTQLDSSNYNSYSPTLTGTGASGTWGISITGNSATVSNITRTASTADLNTLTTSGFYRVSDTNANLPASLSWGQLLTVYGGSDTIGQLYFDYATGYTASRAGNPAVVGGSGSWSAWHTNLNSTNYTSYAVAKNGSSWTPHPSTFRSASWNYFYTDFGYISFGPANASWAHIYSDKNFYFNQGIWINDNRVLDAGNYNTYSPTLTGTGASGTWGISITGNSATVTNGVYTNTSGVIITRTGISTNSTDFNTITTSGTYEVSGNGTWTGSTNGPTSAYQYGLLEVMTNGGNIVTQRYVSHSPSETWVRSKFNSSDWQPWRLLLTSANYNSYAPTLTGSGASGTWGISITGNAATAYGLDVHTGRNSDANKVVRTDSSGYIQAGWINTTSGDNGTAAIDRVYASNDGYIRYYTPTNFRTVLDVPTRTGGSASGTWGINVTGSAGSLSNNSSYMVDRGAIAAANVDTATSNGFYLQSNASDSDGILVFNPGGSLGAFQLYAKYTGLLRFRNRTDNTTWTSWKTILHDANYSSYTMPLTGGSTWSMTNFDFSASTVNIRITSGPGTFNVGDDDIVNLGSSSLSVIPHSRMTSSNAYVSTYAYGVGQGDNRTHFGYLQGGNYVNYIRGAATYIDASLTVGSTITASGGTFTGSRPITFDSANGDIEIRGDSGGWATGLYFIGSSGTYRGGFGGLGSGDSLANFWIGPAYNNTWMTISSSAVNTQVALQQNGNQVLHAGNYTSYSPSLTGTGASGTWGISITGNSATATNVAWSGITSKPTTLNGFGITDALPLAGDTLTGTIKINTSGSASSTSHVIVKRSGAAEPSSFGSYAGSWRSSIEIWNNDSTKMLFLNPPEIDSLYSHIKSVGGGFFIDVGSSGGTRAIQIESTGAANFPVSLSRGGNAVLDAGNYNSYSPTLTGGGASGTWGINVTGSAGSVAWTNVSGRPTAVSSFTNDSGYITSSGSISGNAATATNATNAWQLGTDTASKSNALQYWQLSSNSTLNPSTDWFYALRMSHGDAATYYSATLAFNFFSDIIQYRRKSGGTDASWVTLLHSGNYTSYSPSLTGSGASGTWGINITGSAATATDSTKLPLTGGSITGNLLIVTTEPVLVLRDSNNSGTGAGQVGWISYQDSTGTERAWIGYGSSSSVDLGIYNNRGGVTVNGNTILNAGNYTSYSPSLTGSGASGTWGISITGSAAGVPWSGISSRPSNIMFYEGFTLDANSMSSNSTGFTYSSNAPHTGPVIRVSTGGSYDMWLNAPYIGGNSLSFRTRNGDNGTLNSWRAVLHDGNYTSYSPSLTGSGASGTWGINITGNAATVGTLSIHIGRNNEANKIVRTDGNGYIQAGYINSDSGNEGNNSSPSRVWGTNGSDSYLRTYLTSALSVAYATSAGTATDSSKLPLAGGTMSGLLASHGNSEAFNSANDTTISVRSSGTSTAAVMSFHRPGAYAVNLGLDTDNVFKVGGWSAGSSYAILTAGNYNSYSPTLTGTGASGTWGINITGNASNITSHTINQSVGTGNAPTFADVYTNGWFRNNESGEGLYNQATSNHFYSDGAYWNVGYSGTTGIRLRNGHAGTVLGYLYAETNQNMGLLNSSGNWAVQVYPGATGGGNLAGGWTIGGATPLTSGNYTSYSPSLTGSGASGTWSINITGNANYATTAGSAPANGGTASAVTINYNDDSNSTYQMLWGSGNGVYGTGAIYCNPSTDYLYSGSFVASNWFRSTGATGWYSETYAGGIYMEDTTWVRVYNGKAFYVPNQIAATGNITAYYSDERLKHKLGNITGALEAVRKLNGFRYVNNDTAKSFGYTSDTVQLGVSAQEVESLFPEIISLAPFDMETDEVTGEITSKSGQNYKTVAYDKLVPVLVEALKECSMELDKQQMRIAKLEELVSSLISKE